MGPIKATWTERSTVKTRGESAVILRSASGVYRLGRPDDAATSLPLIAAAPHAAGDALEDGEDVSATLAAARTDAGRVALIERLEEYERKFQAIPRELRATNYVRLNERVEYPREVSEKKRASQEARLARRCRAIAARNVLEERAVTRLHMETRSCGTCAGFGPRARADDEQRHGLDRAVDCVLYVATLLKAQNGFRMACKKLCYCVTFTQRHWRKRAKSCDAHVNLCATQWKTAGFQEAVPMRKMTQLLVDHLRMKRQKHVMALVVYETYDLKPLLVEAVTSRGDRGPRTAVRTFVAETQKRGSMQSVAAEYGLDLTSLPPPKMTVLLEKDELQTLQDIAITQMEQELIRLLRGS
ncbi:procollagen galactosyltransferase [Aureococcus anophagefferens]|nr:procollagen galactosyltransferase [Aureococcus anophagefferens]